MKWLTAHHENTTAPNDNEPDTDNPLPPSNNNGDSQSIQAKGYLSNAANPSAANPSASSGQKQPSIARNKTKIPISTLSIKHSQLFILERTKGTKVFLDQAELLIPTNILLSLLICLEMVCHHRQVIVQVHKMDRVFPI